MNIVTTYRTVKVDSLSKVSILFVTFGVSCG